MSDENKKEQLREVIKSFTPGSDVFPSKASVDSPRRDQSSISSGNNSPTPPEQSLQGIGGNIFSPSKSLLEPQPAPSTDQNPTKTDK